MNAQEAHQLADQLFPNGPEKIAELLGVKVLCEAINIDGWCLVPPNGGAPLITINRNAPATRQRFTLAHEVGHLILGTKPDILGRQNLDLYNPKGSEEIAANQFASELLLPLQRVAPLLTLPIDSSVIARVAKSCRVSEVVLVLRLTKNAAHFGLRHPVVAKLQDDTIAWKLPASYPLTDDAAAALFSSAIANGGTCRSVPSAGHIAMICALRNPTYPVLFYHWLPENVAVQETIAEARARLEEALFANAATLRNRVSGMFGQLKTRIDGLDFDGAVTLFYERYGESLSESYPDVYYGHAFFEYVRVRVSEWRERPQSTPEVPGGFDSDDIPF